MPKVFLIIIFTFIAGILIGYYVGFELGYKNATGREINSYEECAAAGYPIMESYPEQCNTPDGKHFVRNIAAPSLEPIYCTMDALVCPDGSSVGRIPPSCEFAPCPKE